MYIKINIGKCFWRFTASPEIFGEFDARDAILFQINVFGKKLKVTTLARFFIKVNAHRNFV